MKILNVSLRRFLFALTVAGGWIVLPLTVEAFSITGVTLTPTNPVPSGSNIVMTVNITTPGSPASLYQPTQTTLQGNQIGVDLYPASGMLTVIGRLSTNVNIGVLPAGAYQYEVRLHPQFEVGWGVRTNRGGFVVLGPNPPPTNLPPTANIVSPVDGATFSAPANILVLASVSDPDGNVWAAHVEFFEGTNRLGDGQLSDPGPPHNAPFRFYWTNVPPGRYMLTAKVTDEAGAVGVSSAIKIAVGPLPTNSLPVVSIVARDPIATEGTNCYRWPGWPTPFPTTNQGGTNTATFVVRRDGATNNSLTVFYTIGGTASNGVDYKLLPGSVIVPAGLRVAPITIVPVDDSLPEKIETVILGLIEPPYGSPLPSPYVVGKPARAAAIIVDDDQPRPCTGRLPDRCFELTQPGSNGDWFRIECSTNLLDWTVLCTNSVTDGAIHFVDPDTDTATQRFYRAVPEANPPAE